MKKLNNKVRVLHEHDDVEDLPGYHEMVLMGRPGALRHSSNLDVVYRDSIGRESRGAYTRWHVAICNNPWCGAEALVQLDETVKGILSEYGL